MVGLIGWGSIVQVGELRPSGPPVMVPHDPRWTAQAAELLAQLRRALSTVTGVDRCAFDHIGSTAVPGLDAKPYVDLEVRRPTLPDSECWTERSHHPVGFRA